MNAAPAVPGPMAVAVLRASFRAGWRVRLRSLAFGFALLAGIGASDLRAANSIHWHSINPPATGIGGTTISFTATVENTGEDTWGWDHYLELMAMADGAHLWYPSVDGLAPGDQTTVTFWLVLPNNAGTYTYGFTGLEHNVEYFGGTQTRTITVSQAPVYAGVTLSSTTLNPQALPTISTTDPMPPFYKLRAKVIDGSSLGFHAATEWYNNGHPLDMAPPAGNYAVCALYWLKYDSYLGQLLPYPDGIGPERTVPITVLGTVQLSTYTFDGAQPPSLYTTNPFGGAPFRLYATFRNAAGAEWRVNGAMNQNMAPLGALPPAGTYQVDLFWRKFSDSAGNNPVETGPVATAAVTITAGQIEVLNTDGYIHAVGVDDDEGNWSLEYPYGSHDIQVPVPGTLQITVSAPYGTYIELIDWNDENHVLASGAGALTTPVSTGGYRVRVNAGTEGPYHITGHVTPSQVRPTLTGGNSAAGAFGTTYLAANPLYTITASGPGPITYAVANLPAGLSVNPVTGAITGTPAAGTFNQVWVQAANAGGSEGKFITLTIAAAISAPTNLHQTDIGSHYVALAWNAAVGGPAVDHYEISNGPGPIVFTEANELSLLWSGLSPQTAYTFKVRAVDSAGSGSDWVTLSNVSTAAAGTPSGATKWIDLARTVHAGGSNYITTPPDGIRDEVIGVDQTRLVASVVQSSWGYPFNNFWSLWGINWPDGSFTPYFTFALLMEPYWDYEAPEITNVDVALSFISQPGQTYAILLDDSEGHDFHPENAVQHSLPTVYANAAWQTLVAGVDISQLQYSKYFLVRYASPIGAVSIPGTSTSVSVGATRGLGGTLGLPLPISGNVTISVKDTIGALLKAGSDVAWQVWDGINQIRVGTSTVGDLLDLGINTSGQFQVGLKLNDAATVWLNLEVQPPSPPLRSRDRYLTGAIDTAGSYYRVNDLEFVRLATATTAEENLGTYRLDGTTGTFIYNSEEDIFSEPENDAVLNDSLAAGSQQLSQQVVFWRETPGASTIRLSTIFSAVGAVEIRVKKSDGTVLHRINHTLTVEPNFGGLLDHMDARIRSLATPSVSPWSELPPIDWIDEDGSAAAAVTPRRAASAQPATMYSQPTIAATGWQTNFLIKVATTVDGALSSPHYSDRLQFGTGEARGYIDGVWDGFSSDIGGIVELAKMGWESVVKGDHTRAKAMRDGLKLLFTDRAARDKLCEDMLEKFAAKTLAAVPWAFAGDSALWGLDAYAYMYGYMRGFIHEQVGVAMLGAGIVSKAGLVIKGAAESANLAQLTAAMVTNVRRFTVASYVAASRHVAKFGNGAMRAARKAIAEVGKQSVDGVSTVAEQMAVLVERLGAEGVTWHKIADNAFALCVNEAEVARVGISMYPQLAKLQLRLGNLLSKGATEGFFKAWTRGWEKGMTGQYVHYLYEGFDSAAPLTAPELAQFLEIANGTVTTFASSGAWRLHPWARGLMLEEVVARLIGGIRLAPGFPIIDVWKPAEGLVTSIKSLDVTAQTYQSISALTNRVNGYVDLVAAYAGQPTLYGGVIIQEFEILSRQVQLVIRPGASVAQQAALDAAVQRAASLQKPVTLVIREIP